MLGRSHDALKEKSNFLTIIGDIVIYCLRPKQGKAKQSLNQYRDFSKTESYQTNSAEPEGNSIQVV